MFRKDKQPATENRASLYQPTEPDENFGALYERYVQKVYKKCLKMTCDTEDAKDFTQDIFIKVFSKMDTFQNRSMFSTWLYSVSHNYCVDRLKQNARTKLESLSERSENHIDDESAEPADDPFEEMRMLLQTMPAKDVVLLKLKYEEGLSIKEISQRFRLNESTVKMRLKRSRDILRIRYDGGQAPGL